MDNSTQKQSEYALENVDTHNDSHLQNDALDSGNTQSNLTSDTQSNLTSDTQSNLTSDTQINTDSCDDVDSNCSLSKENELELKRILENARTVQLEYDSQLETEKSQRLTDATTNLNIFNTWMKANYDDIDLYNTFKNNFSYKYRSDLFENIFTLFHVTNYVTNDILFYLKCIVYDLIKHSKKYKYLVKNINIDYSKLQTNLKLNAHKQVFKCVLDDDDNDFLCYFKENGNDYYLC